MNICQVITPSKIAGAERSTTSLCEHLQRAGHRVIVGCKQGSPLIPVMREAGLDAHPLAISGKVNLRAPFRIAALARLIDADVIHTQLSTAAWHGSIAARLLRVPSVAHVRALNHPFWYSLATRIIAISRAVKECLVARGVDPARIDVVYNGIDPARYYAPCSREEARARLGLPAGGPLIGVVAHLTPKKGHAYFLDAFARVVPRHPDASAVFVGDGRKREALAEQVRQLGLEGRVIFAGFQPDVLPYYAAMDLVVLPAISMEGLGRALLEGGLLRRATVGTTIGGMKEVIREGETGFLVTPGDVDLLVERMDVLLADPALRDRMGNAAHDWVAATFTSGAMVAGTLESYRRAGVRMACAGEGR
jgi:glycosyltransferase involved in cell wall biosynthesis